MLVATIQPMKRQLALESETVEKIEDRAARCGVSVDELIASLLEPTLGEPADAGDDAWHERMVSYARSVGMSDAQLQAKLHRPFPRTGVLALGTGWADDELSAPLAPAEWP